MANTLGKPKVPQVTAKPKAVFCCACHPKAQQFYRTHSVAVGSFPAPTSHPSPILLSALTTFLPFHHKCCPVEAQRHHEEKIPKKGNLERLSIHTREAPLYMDPCPVQLPSLTGPSMDDIWEVNSIPIQQRVVEPKRSRENTHA